MKKAEYILFDHRSLVWFFFFGLLYMLIPMKMYGSTVHTVLQVIYIAWTGIILVHDLITKKIKFDPLMTALTLFLIWAWISFVFMPKGHGIYPFIHLLELIMFIWVFVPAAKTLSREQTEQYAVIIAWLVIIIITVMNIIAIVFFYLHDQLPFPELIVRLYTSFGVRNGHPRYPGAYKHPVLAGEKCIGGLLCGLMLWDRKKIHPAAAIIAIISCLWMMSLANARTAYVQLVFIALALYVFRFSGNQKYMRFFKGMLAVLVIGAGALVYIKAAQNPGSLFDKLNQISSNRLIIWKTAFEEFLKRPVMGWGWENGDVISQYTQPNILDCHNIIVNLLLWTGIPGTAAFLAACVIWIKKLLDNKGILRDKAYRWYILITAMFFLQSLLDILIVGEDWRLGTPMFWAFAGIVYYYRKKDAEVQ